jgi:hypothetical protein
MTDKTDKSQTARVILSKPSQWDTWLELVKTYAIRKGVWDLINPDSVGPVPGPEPEPTLPMPADVNPEKTTYSRLTADEKEELTVLRENYQRALKKWDRKQQGLVDLRAAIQESVAMGAPFDCTIGLDTAKDMLITLKRRFSPTDESREKEIQDEYFQLRTTPMHKADTALDVYLDNWDRVYERARKRDLPDVSGKRAHLDFLRVVEFSNEAWVAIQREKIDETVPPDFHEFVSRFRAYLRDRTGFSRGTFSVSTLQGEEAPERPRKRREDCLCGETHRFVECRYFNVKMQTGGWKPDEGKTNQIIEKLQAHQTLFDVVKRLAEKGNLQPIQAIQKVIGTPRIVGSA